MRFALSIVLAALAWNLYASVGACAEPPKPNVIFILSDDVGIGDLGPYGQQTIQTPNLDQLAADGISFSQMYSGAPVCSPSRAVLMTGLHNGRHPNGNGVNLQAGNETVAEVLKTQGYATGGFGKWHLGGSGQSLPTNQGFDEYYGILGGVAAWDHFNPTMQRLNAANPSTVVNEANNGGFTDDLVGAEAAQFVRSNAQSGQPFYAQVNFQLAHFDMEVPELEPYTINQSWPESRKIFASMISRLDRLVGDIVAAVDDPNGDGDTSDSAADNTLLVFASDNGTHIEPAACCKGNHGPDLGVFSDDAHDPEFFDSNGQYRGWKRDLYDGGIKTPFIARWAGTIAPGQRNDTHFGDFADFLPTVAELAGADAPVGIDGESFAHVLTDTTDATDFEREFQYFEGSGSLNGLPSPSPRRALVRDGWKAIELNNGQIELYNLLNDPTESNNLFSQNQALAQEMIDIASLQDGGQIQYRTWVGSDFFNESQGWAQNQSPGSNAIATLTGDGSSPRDVFANASVNVLALDVGHGPTPTRMIVMDGQSLNAPNGIRVRNGSQLRLEQATASTTRRLELKGGTLTGHGTVIGTVVNQGSVSPDGASSSPPVPPLPDKALVFDFSGIQDDAPLTQTIVIDPRLTLSDGLDFGPSTQARSDGPNGITSTDAGNEFNVSGFDQASLAAAIAAGDYISYTVQPTPGYDLVLDSVTFDLWRNGVSAANDYAILTSIGGFSLGNELAQLNNVVDDGIASQRTFEAVSTSADRLGAPIEVRLYGWNANNDLANTHVNDVTFDANFIRSDAVDAIDFDFSGVQDIAPLTQTSFLHPNMTLVSGLEFGPSAQPRSAGPDGSTSTDAGDEFNAGGFDADSLAAAIAAEDYLTFSVQPVAGFEMILGSVSFDLWRNGANAANDYAILTSVDGFSAGNSLAQLNDITSDGAGSQQTFTGYYSGDQTVTEPFEVRLYAWNANDDLASTHVTAASMDASFILASELAASFGETSGSPVGTLSLDGDFIQLSDGTLQMGIGGLTADSQHDQLIVTGSVYLEGTLDVTLEDLGSGTFVPNPGDSFDILTFNGELAGTFDTLIAPALAGGMDWVVDYRSDRVTLVATFSADFDLNGRVDEADLIYWENTYAALDGQDFLTWQRQNGLGTGASRTSVPEPSVAALLSLAALTAVSVRRR